MLPSPVQTLDAFDARRTDTLIRIFEATAEPVAVFDGIGRMTQLSRLLRDRLNSVDKRILQPQLESFANHVAATGRSQCIGPVIETIGERECNGVLATYRMTGVYCGATVLDSGSNVVIKVHIEAATVSDVEGFARRYNLTKKQVAVAGLVASGMRNSEIAQKLFISEHTARHHVEQIRIKMGVRSRTAIAARVLESGATWADQ